MSLGDVFPGVRSQQVPLAATAPPQQSWLPSPVVPAVSFIDLPDILSKSLYSEEDVPVPGPDTVYRVSSLVQFCAREQTLCAFHGVATKNVVESRLRRTFDFGRAFHEIVQNEWLVKQGLWGDWSCPECPGEVFRRGVVPSHCLACGGEKFKYKELVVNNSEHKIQGHVDGVISRGNKNWVLELKSCNSKQFDLIVRMKKKPLDYHIKQVQMYMFLLDIKDGIILYMDKDESHLHQFDVKFEEIIVEGVLHQLEKARRAMSDKIIVPEKICDTKSCVRAKRCGVRELCFK